MRLNFLLLLFITILSISCSNSGTDSVAGGGGLETEVVALVYGNIVDTNGTPIESTTVIANKFDQNNSLISSDTAYTDKNGKYIFNDLDTGSYKIDAEKNIQNIIYTADIGKIYNDNSDKNLGTATLIATGYIKGSITTEIVPKENHYLGILVYIPGSSFSAYTDSAGDFVMSSVPVDTHDIAIKCDAYPIFTTTAIVTAPGDTANLGAIILKKSTTPTDTISVVVGSVEKKGVGVTSGVTVSIVNKENSSTAFSTQSTNDGSFIFDSIPFGNYSVTVGANLEPEYTTYKSDITVNSTPDTLKLGVISLEKKTTSPKLVKMISIPKGLSLKDSRDYNAGVSAFFMGETEITLGQYREFMPNFMNGSGDNGNENTAVAGVNFSDVIRFCNWLSLREGYDSCYSWDKTKNGTKRHGDDNWWDLDTSKNGYRLPTGDEFEWAAEGGNAYDYGTDDGTVKQSLIPQQSNAWWTMPADDIVQEVKFFNPNGYGLYDMSGNVWEYTWEKDILNKPNARFDWIDDNSTINMYSARVRGSSAIHSQALFSFSWEKAKIDKVHPVFNTVFKSVGFRVVRRD